MPNLRTVQVCFLIIAVVLIYIPVYAQKVVKSTDPDLREQWYDQHFKMVGDSRFSDLKWQFIGPTNISGRVTDVDVVTPKGKNYTIYVATASGGVWKSVNEGTTWDPVFEHGISTSIGDVTIDPSNQDRVWIGTGEANIFRSSMAGGGVYLSNDAGKTWEHKGLTGTHTIPRIIVHPDNSDIVYVASSGHEWTDNEERGLYMSKDGGNTWDKIFFVDERTGVIDLVMDPSNNEVLYLATWQRIRKKWHDPRVEPGYTKSGIYKSTDGGRNWREINSGLPEAKFRGRIGIDISRSNPNTLYAFIDNYDIGKKAQPGELDSYGRQKKDVIKGAEVYRTDDGGTNWRKVSETNDYMMGLCATYGWVFGQIRVDPNDVNTIYVMGLALNVSNDGGKTFRRLRGMHGDHHALWIDPENSQYLVNGNDGGVVISFDGGKTWKQNLDNLPAVQFFNLMYDMDTPFRVYGSVQDHGSFRGVVDISKGKDNIPAVEFESAPGGEGSSHAIDPTNPDRVYSAGFYGRIQRSDMSRPGRSRWESHFTEGILPKVGPGEQDLRGQWVAPFIISPHDPNVIYHGMQYVFRSRHQGDSWERISPDLTFNNPDEIGDIPYQTLFALSESPLRFGLLYAGTDDGKLHLTMNGGKNWKDISKGLAHRKWISRVVASAFSESVVYAVQNGKRDDDFAAYVWKSEDFGKNWTDISANIPCGPINVIREDPVNPDILYVGTDLGVYVTIDGGLNWHSLPAELPTTFVHDLVIHPRDRIMVIATHGRGVYAIDVKPIRGAARN